MRTRTHRTAVLASYIQTVQCHTVYKKYTCGWKTVTRNPEMTRKFKEFAKMYCACNTSPKLALRTSVTTGHVACRFNAGRGRARDAD